MKIRLLIIITCLLGTVISCKKNISTPRVKTLDISDITDTSAVLSYEVAEIQTAKKPFAMGIIWNETPNLDYAENKRAVKPMDGTFTMHIGRLKPHTTYYARAFASSSDFSVTSFYGNEIKFFTDSSDVIIINHNGSSMYVYPSSFKATWHLYDFQFMGATSQYDGYANTILVNSQSYTAQLCTDLVAYGFSDWYLPSINELYFLYSNKDSIAKNDSSIYWSGGQYTYLSSTEINNSDIKALKFNNGNIFSLLKSGKGLCRCIRK